MTNFQKNCDRVVDNKVVIIANCELQEAEKHLLLYCEIAPTQATTIAYSIGQ